jgi:hypothetical protein
MNMPYQITRKDSALNPKIVGLGLFDLGLLFLAPLLNLFPLGIFFLIVMNWKDGADAMIRLGLPGGAFGAGVVIYWLMWAVPVGIIFLRWSSAIKKGRESNQQWEHFINLGFNPDFEVNATLGSGGVAKFPVLDESSGPARWLETIDFQFLAPVTINLPDAHLAPSFSIEFEELLFKRVKQHASANGADNPAFGRVIIHGKTYSLIFRQPNDDSIVVFLSRMEIAGTVASLICGGCGFIRRKSATGEKARKKLMSDDRVYLHKINEMQNMKSGNGLLPICVPIFGIVHTLSMLGAYVRTFIFNDAPYSWVRFGELGAYREVDREIQMIDWEGLKPDRTSVIASIDYLAKMATNEIIKEAHSICLSPRSFGPIHSGSANPQGEAASKIDYL